MSGKPPGELLFRRRWSRRKSAAVGCLGALLVLLGAVGGYLAWANLLPPPEPEPPLPVPNGYDAVLAAARRLQRDTATTRFLDDPRNAPVEALRRELVLAEPGRRQLAAAMRLEYRTPFRDLFSEDYSYASPWRRAARILACRSKVQLADKRPGEAFRTALNIIELGSRVGRGGAFLDYHTGYALRTIGQRAAFPAIPELSAAEAWTAGARLEHIMTCWPTYPDLVETERRRTLKFYRDMVTRRTDYLQELDGDTPAWRSRLPYLWLYPKAHAYQMLDAFYRATASEAAKPSPRQVPIPLPEIPYLDILDPYSTSATFACNTAYLRLLRLELALQEYHQKWGRYPARLTDLPNLSAAARIDPFSERPFLYRRSGTAYLLYSIGADRRDDGGRSIPRLSRPREAAGDLVAGPRDPLRRRRTPR